MILYFFKNTLAFSRLIINVSLTLVYTLERCLQTRMAKKIFFQRSLRHGYHELINILNFILLV